ncbi:MAG TPA: GntR family transcriptional regulator [Gemmatimonadaceae bacterium]|nr:GntR family transcriptional regulator [Gemmatimonadaceae bacterium]
MVAASKAAISHLRGNSIADLATTTIHLRDRIVSGLHRGRLHGGDRLPSFRQVAEYSGADPRVVAEAYRVLEGEGLVTIRGRSGVYVAEQERLGEGAVLSETSRWMASVAAEAWKRRITLPDLPEMVRRCTGSVRLRTAFVESTEDHMVAFTAELEPALGLECRSVYLPADGLKAGSSEASRLRAEIGEVDLIVTTAFHSALVHQMTEGIATPLVAVSAHPDLGRAIQQRIRQGALTVVCVDPRFADRIRSVYSGGHADRVHTVLVKDNSAVNQLNRSEPVLLTRAARRKLEDLDLPMIVPHSPTLSFESVRELSEVIIRLNLERG